MKNVPVYFYFLDVKHSKAPSDDKNYTVNDFITDFTKFLNELVAQNLVDRKLDFTGDEKIIWLDSFTDLKSGNFDLIFKTAKYNHQRGVINTLNMTQKGVIKEKSDGDEEKIHMCIRYAMGQDKFICLFENNYYSVGIGKTIKYLNEMLYQYHTRHLSVTWILSTEIMPGDGFLEELKKMKRISLLTITVDRNKMGDEFQALAGRDDIRDTIDISVRKIKRNINIPSNLVSDYYNGMRDDNKIKRIIVDGKNETGPFRLDTELIKKKQCLTVETTALNEVSSESFFKQAQIELNSMR